MSVRFVPAPETIASQFVAALGAAKRLDSPYRRWSLVNVFPEALCVATLILPIAPPMLGVTDGTRNAYNMRRTFFTPELRAQYPVCENMALALQRSDVARRFEDVLDFKAAGTFLRIEYIQDLDGMWLEPHRDVAEKVFSMVLYLCTGPHAKDWGTDIYGEGKQWVGRSSAEFNTAAIFKAGPNTWHGFDKRPIVGVRRLMEINYVRDWRDRGQLAFPNQPIACA